MRWTAPGLHPRGEAATILVGGRPVECSVGDTVAAALVAAGELTCRLTRQGDPRGVFCGMGVCHDCVMTVDGTAMRTCMTPVRDGLRVEVEADMQLPAGRDVRLERVVLSPDVLVVGAGPGGLAAAAAAAEGGASVLLVDERSKLGGQYFKQPSDAFVVDERAIDRQYRQGRELAARAERAGVTALGGVQVWAASGPHELHAVGGGRAYTLRPRRLVLATGAYERGVPLPGWTLPGFMATGAAQTLMRAYGVLPGRRVLVSGNGPLNVQVAADLVRAGVTVVALCETARAASPARAGTLAAMAAAAPDLMRDGIAYARALRAARVPLLFGHAVVRADGDGRVERATVARLDAGGRPVPGSERSFDVDAVCAGFGFLPSNELARTLGVAHAYDAQLGQLAAVRGRDGSTSVEHVWVIGDSGGTGGARLAQAVGLLAGAAAAGAPAPAGAERGRRRNERFQRALRRLYAGPRLVDQLADPDTLVCRCESVPLRAVDEGLSGGIATIGALKRVTRAGMGRCQGRYCASILAELAARRSGNPLGEDDWFAPGVPFKPLPVEVVAAAVGGITDAVRRR
jgi:NADPH-dependent 2,4-dienoyl-CoA reductase/sulfur reductase-like enzyme